MRRIVSALLCLLAGGCSYPIVVDPVDPPAPVNPPVDPTPPPVVNPTTGTIDDAGYAALDVGATEAAVLARLGAPFRKSEAAGFTIYVYAFKDSSSVAWLYFSAGVVVRKARL